MKPVGIFRALVCAVLAVAAVPSHARFLQVDPVGYDDQINLYTYVHNDPINATDPDGQQTVWDMQREEEAFDASLRGKSPAEMRAAVMDRSTTQLGAMATMGSFALPGGLIVRGGAMVARAAGLTRAANAFLPAATRAATLQRFGFAKSAMGALEKGGGKIIAGPGASKGDAFRKAGEFASKHGGEAKDYVKVSVTGVTESGERVSVHAVRNLETGKIYDPKLLIGR